MDHAFNITGAYKNHLINSYIQAQYRNYKDWGFFYNNDQTILIFWIDANNNIYVHNSVNQINSRNKTNILNMLYRLIEEYPGIKFASRRFDIENIDQESLYDYFEDIFF